MKKDFVAIPTLCSHYEIEVSFIDALHQTGLIQLEVIEEQDCVHHDQIRDLEKMIRIHQDLNVNIEGIDVVFNLLEKQRQLREEVTQLKNKLKRYE